MFVVTPEFQEFIDDMKQLVRLMKRPRFWFSSIVIGTCFMSIYFGMIILADIIQGLN